MIEGAGQSATVGFTANAPGGNVAPAVICG